MNNAKDKTQQRRQIMGKLENQTLWNKDLLFLNYITNLMKFNEANKQI